jgi:streptogramin lyase
MRFLAAAALSLVVVSTAAARSVDAPIATHVVATGKAPCGIDARAGSIWVSVYETGRLLQLDDRRGSLETEVDVGPWPCRVAVGPAAVWVLRDRPGELVRISRSTGSIERTSVGSEAFDLALTGGSVWTTSYDHGLVAQLDAATMQPIRVYRDGPKPAGIVPCGGRIWVGHGGDVTWVTSIQPGAQRIRRVRIGAAEPDWPECIRGVVWVATADSLIRIDPRSRRILSRMRLDETLADVAAGPDHLVWVTDKQHSVVYRVDPLGRRIVDSFPAGPGAFALARAGAAMWITSFAGGDVRRYVP